ncbi:MAG TPA: 4Fe-4S dicluster domain-containing protein, partial [Candidatus Binataceae bacterium]|nr:4Fe-4S dicluster domain-containing protein [Candidatus Binataceae bacterium]
MASAPGSPEPAAKVVDYELLLDCVHCGLCAEACPTYTITRREMDSPRGRIYLMKSLAEGQISLDADAARHLDLCLGCRGCETACPSGVHYGRMIEEARVYVERNFERGLLDRIRRHIIGSIFPYPTRLRAILAPLGIVDRTGLRPLLRAVMPPAIRNWLDLLPSLAENNRPLLPAKAPRTGAPMVAIHPGCVARVMADSKNLNTQRALAAAGYGTIRLDALSCCGALDLHSGNATRAREFA